MDHLHWENRLAFCQGGDEHEEVYRIGRIWVGQVEGGLYGVPDIEALERYIEFCHLEGVSFVPWLELSVFVDGLGDLEDHLVDLCHVMKQMGWTAATILSR